MAIVKMFRDRVVSMEQTLELGEKYLDVLSELIAEAFPGSGVLSHELEAEIDLFTIVVGGESSRPRRIKFTRMVLSDATCLPAVAAERSAPVRDRLVSSLRGQAEKDEILVTFRAVMDDEDRTVGDEVDAEWRKLEEVAAAARQAEEERRAEEKRRQRDIEAARHKARREKQRGASVGKAAVAVPQAATTPGSGKKRRRRGGGGQNGQSQKPGQPQQARPAGRQGQAPQGGPRPHPQHPRPPQPQQPQQPQAPRPPQEGATGGAEAAGGGRRRKRRRRRGGGGSGGGPKPAGAGDGGAL